MKQVDIYSVVRSLRREVGKILTDFRYECPEGTATCEHIEVRVRALCVIWLHDVWVRFNRRLIVESARGRPRTVTGHRLSPAPGVASPQSVILQLRRLNPKKPPWWEPRWGDPTECIDAARRLRVTNLSTISAGLGSTPSPVDDLRLTRNFYAHRGQETAHDVIQIIRRNGLTGIQHADQLIVAPIAPGMLLFENWAFDLLVIAEAAVQ